MRGPSLGPVKSPTGRERQRETVELAYLRTERHEVAAKLKRVSGVSYPARCARADRVAAVVIRRREAIELMSKRHFDFSHEL